MEEEKKNPNANQDKNFHLKTTETRSLPMARPVSREYRSVICCGIAHDPSAAERTMTQYCAYFGEDVELFMAEIDPLRQILYRPSLLSKKFGWSTNRIGMLLKRKRVEHEGVFQCIGYKYKPAGAVGLKKGGYFVSLEACKMIEEEFHGQPSSEVLDELSARSSPLPEAFVSTQSPPSAALPIRTIIANDLSTPIQATLLPANSWHSSTSLPANSWNSSTVLPATSWNQSTDRNSALVAAAPMWNPTTSHDSSSRFVQREYSSNMSSSSTHQVHHLHQRTSSSSIDPAAIPVLNFPNSAIASEPPPAPPGPDASQLPTAAYYVVSNTMYPASSSNFYTNGPAFYIPAEYSASNYVLTSDSSDTNSSLYSNTTTSAPTNQNSYAAPYLQPATAAVPANVYTTAYSHANLLEPLQGCECQHCQLKRIRPSGY